MILGVKSVEVVLSPGVVLTICISPSLPPLNSKGNLRGEGPLNQVWIVWTVGSVDPGGKIINSISWG